ncbi:hypothetical protein L3Q82_022791, partial [Scortum barcoo]
KSRLAQIKARRRSNIGVRGSPETNSLIRFMAQQRMKTSPVAQTPELVRSSPFLPRVASTLRQKMASFQNLMDVEESEVCDLTPRQDSNTGGCIKTRDYLSDGNSHDGGKENHPPMVTPIPSKRRRLGPSDGCDEEIRRPSTGILHLSLKEKEEDKEAETQVLTQGPPPCSETLEETPAVVISPPFPADFELQAGSPSENQQCFTVFSGDDGTIRKRTKRVRFGGPLSPELFDKSLPPSTPLQKGATPARAPTPGGSLQLRSVLKTPQRSESQTPQAQADLSSPSLFGASPTLAMPRNRRTHSEGKDSEEEDGKIVFPSMEDIESAVTRDTEYTWDAQPLNLNAAFHEESLSQILTESETEPGTALKLDVLEEPTSLPEKEKQLETAEAPAPSRNRRKKQPGPEPESTTEAPARSSSRKRKCVRECVREKVYITYPHTNSVFPQQPVECEPVKRSTRSAAKSASGKMKMTSTAARRWNRDVDRSLYGSRAYASKNPTLSPITERLSFINQFSAAQQTPSTICTDPNHETFSNPKTTDTQVMSDVTVTNTLEGPPEDSLTSPKSSKESATGNVRRRSGPKVRGRGQKKRKISVADDIVLSEETQDQTGGKEEEHCEEQTTTNLETSRETPLNHTVPEEGADTAELNVDTHCTGSDGKLECRGSPRSDCPPSGEESNNILSLPLELAQKKTKRGRRSSVNSSVMQEQGNQAEEHQTSHEVEEKEQGDQAASQQENLRSSSDSQEEDGVNNMDLAPWQADFNFEDVFKSVATRGQRSVRRSLRNQSTAEHSSSDAGLAWLPRTSPDAGREARRRTRGRQLSAALPAQPSLPEETQDDAS